MKILITGGLGYIGSHTCIELLNAGHDVLAIDNLVNSKISVAERVRQICGKQLAHRVLDLRDRTALEALFEECQFDAVIHFAALKAVGESVSQPLRYYDNNIAGSLVLFETMQKFGVRRLVFSSSATVYGNPASVPIYEDFPLSATNPYGRSKLIIEEMLRDLVIADPSWHIALLRYFNPVGAHPSGLIGEDPNGVPNNLMPFIARVASGKAPKLAVYGGDYPTKDGTGVRDYIHVVDLAVGHVKTMNRISDSAGIFTCNLGTGTGYSVLEMINAFSEATGKTVPYEIVARRPGDIASCYANTDLAHKELGWRAERGIVQMCQDTWRWQQYANDNGLA